ncbi:MAG: type II toxin-antitoxin system HicA family toxin [Spirochaetes bacterium]|nr:type II toxin-antitoxin system HicA family toxin [Spirochaetota bacterium]
MSKHEKLLNRFLTKPKNFTYIELKKLLSGFGYTEYNKGATSGSRVSFFNNETKHLISLHKPHPGQILKNYQITLIIEDLKNKGVLS